MSSTDSSPEAPARSFVEDPTMAPGSSGLEVWDEDFDADAWIGRTIDGRYHVVELIGAGGMGAVFAVEHAQLRHRFALKVLLPSLLSHREVVERFEREALAMAQLDHPHIASAIDFGVLDDGSRYMVMPFVPGLSVGEWCAAEGGIDWRMASAIGAQVADALAAAHSREIIHRDLKPDNILIDRGIDGSLRATILDFGIARVRATGIDQKASEKLHTLTRVGNVMGTPGYMAPEQGAGQPVDERADLYSLGVILWEMLTGGRLFDPASPFSEILTKQLTQSAPGIETKHTAAPPGLRELVAELLAGKPDERPSSAAEVRERLRALAYADEEGATVGGRLARVADAAAAKTPGGARGLGIGLLSLFFVWSALAFNLGSSMSGDGTPSTQAVTNPVAEAESLVEMPSLGDVLSSDGAPDGFADEVETLRTASRSRERRTAARALLASGAEIPDWLRAVAEFEKTSGCNSRKAAIEAMVSADDDRALPTLQRVVDAPTSGCGMLRNKDCHRCYRQAATQAVAAID